MTALASTDQIRAMQAARRRAGISDDDWRARLQREAGVTSTKDVPAATALRILDGFNGGSKGVRTAAVKGAKALSGPYVGKLRALWLTGYNLGVVRVSTDVAMLSFIERQTGIANTRFLIDAGDARSAIEGLKQWIAREAVFEWPDDKDPRAIKEAVLTRQWAILIDLGRVVLRFAADLDLASYLSIPLNTPRRYVSLSEFSDAQLDEGSKILGRMIRKAKDAK